MFPPEEAKDLRAWLKTGGFPLIIEEAVLKGSLVTPAWLKAAKARIEKKRKDEPRPARATNAAAA
jgi:hypothetical protein